MTILVGWETGEANLDDIFRHALFCDVLLLYSPDYVILSDMREKCGAFFPGGFWQEDHAKCIGGGGGGKSARPFLGMKSARPRAMAPCPAPPP